jgi:hypothetical protein
MMKTSSRAADGACRSNKQVGIEKGLSKSAISIIKMDVSRTRPRSDSTAPTIADAVSAVI